MELIYQMGRVNAYRSRLYEIARQRLELKEAAAADTDHLNHVHHEVFRIEENLVLVEVRSSLPFALLLNPHPSPT